MGTKNNPGKFDCYEKAEPDEPMFVLLGRDRFGPLLVRMWAGFRQADGEPEEVVREAMNCADAMMRFREVRNILKPRAEGAEYLPHVTAAKLERDSNSLDVSKFQHNASGLARELVAGGLVTGQNGSLRQWLEIFLTEALCRFAEVEVKAEIQRQERLHGWRPILTLPEENEMVIAGVPPSAKFPKGRVMLWTVNALRVAMRDDAPEHLKFPATRWMPAPDAPRE